MADGFPIQGELRAVLDLALAFSDDAAEFDFLFSLEGEECFPPAKISLAARDRPAEIDLPGRVLFGGLGPVGHQSAFDVDFLESRPGDR